MRRKEQSTSVCGGGNINRGNLGLGSRQRWQELNQQTAAIAAELVFMEAAAVTVAAAAVTMAMVAATCQPHGSGDSGADSKKNVQVLWQKAKVYSSVGLFVKYVRRTLFFFKKNEMSTLVMGNYKKNRWNRTKTIYFVRPSTFLPPIHPVTSKVTKNLSSCNQASMEQPHFALEDIRPPPPAREESERRPVGPR